MKSYSNSPGRNSAIWANVPHFTALSPSVRMAQLSNKWSSDDRDNQCLTILCSNVGCMSVAKHAPNQRILVLRFAACSVNRKRLFLVGRKALLGQPKRVRESTIDPVDAPHFQVCTEKRSALWAKLWQGWWQDESASHQPP